MSNLTNVAVISLGIVPLLIGGVPEPDRPSYAGLGVPLFPDASIQTAVSDGDWTYARNATAPEDDEEVYEDRAVAPGAEYLFDRRVDPGENVNLVAREHCQHRDHSNFVNPRLGPTQIDRR
jgi:hypothetical protein